MKKFVSWRRVSTVKQGRSGLGLEAQKEIIDYFVARDGGEIIADYTEVYTGKELEHCVELRNAIAHAKRENAVLIIAKTDRFRNVIEALTIYEEMGDGNILFCDLPSSDKFTLTIFFAIAEREALITSIRTKQALAQKKKQGFKLGNPRAMEIGGALEKAIAAAAENKKAAARTNPNNILFVKLYKTYLQNNSPLRRKSCAKFVEMLREFNAKTATGLEFNEVRCWVMYQSLKRQGILTV